MGRVVSTRGEPRNQIQNEVIANAATEEKNVIVTERLMSPDEENLIKILILVAMIIMIILVAMITMIILNPDNHDHPD